VILIADNEGKLGNLASGDTKEIFLTLQVTTRFKAKGNLPLYLNLKEFKHKGDLKDFNLPITLNQKPPKTNVVTVAADLDQLQKDLPKVESRSKRFTINTGSVMNIRGVAPSKTKRPKSIGVVFGISKYNELVPAPYADNDALIMKDYFEKVLGVNQVLSFTNSEVSGFKFDDIFNAENGDLAKFVDKGETEVFVFYSGHGVPDKTGEHTYLFPSDGKISRLETQGYGIERLYENLVKLGAKHVTVILDACFSGASRSTQKIAVENLVAQKGVKIKPKKPWVNNPAFTVINSSTGEETSLGFDASESGLFTYYMCAGLQGKADANGDHKITLGELKAYVKENVISMSKKISGQQTPEFEGDDNTVLVQY
jgi:hypothetical protein